MEKNMTTAPDLFGKPSETPALDRFTTADHFGHLVLFAGNTSEVFDGDYGTQNVSRCEIVACLDHDNPQTFIDVLIFGAALAPTIYRNTSEVVVGVIDKNGQAWVLADPTDSQANQAETWFKANINKNDGGTWSYGPDEAPF